jgi:hypothetical protein
MTLWSDFLQKTYSQDQRTYELQASEEHATIAFYQQAPMLCNLHQAHRALFRRIAAPVRYCWPALYSREDIAMYSLQGTATT